LAMPMAIAVLPAHKETQMCQQACRAAGA
jgi:hypothetical protein